MYRMSLNLVRTKTSKGENFILINDLVQEIIVFSYHTNIQFMCDQEKIFTDGTFENCTKHFLQFIPYMCVLVTFM